MGKNCMNTKLNSARRLVLLALVWSGSMPLSSFAATNGNNVGRTNVGYIQTNLVSNVPGVAKREDPLAINSWGIVRGRSAIWVNQNGTGVLSGYSVSGAVRPGSIINIPGPPGSTNVGRPTGLEFNGTEGFV